MIDLCQLLAVPVPHDGDYKFEYPLKGATGTDFADLYKRGCFIWEAKQPRAKGLRKVPPLPGELDLFGESERWPATARAWESLMENARAQAIRYACHLPRSHSRPPFILICDVGHCIDVFADFTGMGCHYQPYPDAENFRVRLEDFSSPLVQNRFRAIWEDPHSLNPVTRCDRALREIAGSIDMVSRRLEVLHPEEVALPMMRRLFTLLFEQPDLIDNARFLELLAQG